MKLKLIDMSRPQPLRAPEYKLAAVFVDKPLIDIGRYERLLIGNQAKGGECGENTGKEKPPIP